MPLPTENFIVFKNSRGNKPGDHVEMLDERQRQVSPFSRKTETLLRGAAVKGGTLTHYVSRSRFEEAILQYGLLAD